MNHSYTAELKKIKKNNGHAALLTEVNRTRPRGGWAGQSCGAKLLLLLLQVFFFLFFFPAGVWRLCRRATWPLYKSSHSRLEVCVVSASPRPVFLPLPPAHCPPLPPPLSLPARLSDSSFTLPPVVSLPPASAPSKKTKTNYRARARARTVAQTTDRCMDF